MSRYTGKTCRLLCMICLTAAFFVVEIVVGYVTNSLALVGDSYHMLSDVIALIIGFASVRISKWRSRKNTYGWARAEVLGALINAVFLVALCFTILIEALQRIVHDDHIHQPDLMLIVGGVGLAINVIGLIMFGSHGHSHGGHGHSHGGHTHLVHNDEDDQQDTGEDDVSGAPDVMDTNISVMVNGEIVKGDSDTEDGGETPNVNKSLKSSAQLNMRAVFLHVMGDALGSVIVIVSALVIKYVDGEWKYKLDPAMSLILVIIILSTTIPLLRESALILLQTVPTHIQVVDLKQKLVSKVEGVLGVHEFHIWQLAGNRIIASAHIRCQNLRDYMKIAEEVKLFFHNEGIHSTTIQPEFVEPSESLCKFAPTCQMDSKTCLLDCPSKHKCAGMKCCPDDRQKLRKSPSWIKRCRKRRHTNSETLSEVTVSPPTQTKKTAAANTSNPNLADGGTVNGNVPPDKSPCKSQGSPAASCTAPSMGRYNHSLPSVNYSGVQTHVLPPEVELKRPRSLFTVRSGNDGGLQERAASSNVVSGTQEKVPLLAEDMSARHSSSPTTDKGPLCNSADQLNSDIKKLKQDWKAIRGDAASRESVLS